MKKKELYLMKAKRIVDVIFMKGITAISLILLAGLACAYPPEQQTTLDGMNLSFKLGIAYEKASQGQNVTEFNALVDEYNAWILQHIGGDAGLLKSKLNETAAAITRTAADGTQSLVRPFNASSELYQFGKTEAYVATGISTSQSEEHAIEQKAENL